MNDEIGSGYCCDGCGRECPLPIPDEWHWHELGSDEPRELKTLFTDEGEPYMVMVDQFALHCGEPDYETDGNAPHENA